jgi:hypothetical protein
MNKFRAMIDIRAGHSLFWEAISDTLRCSVQNMDKERVAGILEHLTVNTKEMSTNKV